MEKIAQKTAGVKILSLELENVKRVQAVEMTPSPTGLTVIGGGNCQGKTTILDAIAYALGGEKKRPTNLQREGGSAEARIEVVLSNGLKVERKGKNASLKVTDPSGTKGGQKLLDSFIDELALDMPKFLAMSGKDKGTVLLRILGISDQLAELEREERAAYEERTAQGRVADQKTKYAAEMPEHHDAPEALISATELVAEAQAVMARNAERATARAQTDKLRIAAERLTESIAAEQNSLTRLKQEVSLAQFRLGDLKERLAKGTTELQSAEVAPVTADETTADIERRMDEMELMNAKVRANLDKRKALDDAAEGKAQYDRLSAKVDDVRGRRNALLDDASMPLHGLSVENGELTMFGKSWDCMSGAEQIRAGVGIVRKLKPECGFVLLDKLEAMDLQQLEALGQWLEANGLQAIATRVSTGEECSIVIEDGLVLDRTEKTTTEKEW